MSVEQFFDFVVKSEKKLTLQELNEKFISLVSSRSDVIEVCEQLKKKFLDRLLSEETNEEQSRQSNRFLIHNLYYVLSWYPRRKGQLCPIRNNDDWNSMLGIKLTGGRFIDSIAAHYYINREGADEKKSHIPEIGRLLKRDVERINEEFGQKLFNYQISMFRRVATIGMMLMLGAVILSAIFFPPLFIPLFVAMFVVPFIVGYYVSNKLTNKVQVEAAQAAENAYEAFIKAQEVANKDQITVTPPEPTNSASPAQSHRPSNVSDNESKLDVVPKQPVVSGVLPSSCGIFSNKMKGSNPPATLGVSQTGNPAPILSPTASTSKANGR